jgi:pantetheine-phosphate adenylyltransferase
VKRGKVLYAGTFDPITLGHQDMIRRASEMFDDVVVGIAVNTRKKPLLPVEDRLLLLEKVTAGLNNVKAVAYQGMTIEYARQIGAQSLLRGLRNPSDFQIEFQMAITNRTLSPDLETVFFPSAPAYTFINSCLVREVATSGGDITPFVPASVLEMLQDMLKRRIAALPNKFEPEFAG